MNAPVQPEPPSQPTQSQETRLPLLVVILGPTASGKSALAVALAQRFSGEIVSCDSVAVYRHFDIGTAKPSREQRAAVPHYLIDVAEPDEPFTAGEYSRQARAAIGEIAARGKLPIVVGGTGLYLRALLEGLFSGPQRSEELRERLRARDSRHLHRVLTKLDRKAADVIHPNDAPKLIRAIEVCLASRSKMSELWQQRGREPLVGYLILRIGLNPARVKLYERINLRAQQMFEDGLVEETKALIERYRDKKVGALDSLGYRQGGQFLRGELSMEEAISAAQQGHRNYAKRQMTWFRREPEVTWVDGFGDEVGNDAAGLIEGLLDELSS
jgi:tRNA dimethylallyltransferase